MGTSQAKYESYAMPKIEKEVLDKAMGKIQMEREEERRAKRERILKGLAVGAGIFVGIVLGGGAVMAVRKEIGKGKGEYDNGITKYKIPETYYRYLTFTPSKFFDPNAPDIMDTEEWERLNDYLLNNTDFDEDEAFVICSDIFDKYRDEFDKQFPNSCEI